MFTLPQKLHFEILKTITRNRSDSIPTLPTFLSHRKEDPRSSMPFRNSESVLCHHASAEICLEPVHTWQIGCCALNVIQVFRQSRQRAISSMLAPGSQ